MQANIPLTFKNIWGDLFCGLKQNFLRNDSRC